MYMYMYCCRVSGTCTSNTEYMIYKFILVMQDFFWGGVSYLLRILCGIHNHTPERCIEYYLDKSCYASSHPLQTVGRPNGLQILADYHRDPGGRSPRGKGRYISHPSRSPGIFCTSVPLDNSLPRISANCTSSMTGSFRNPLGEKGVVYDCTYLKESYQKDGDISIVHRFTKRSF